MAKLYVTEYRQDAYDAPLPVEPALADQVITFSTNTQSAAFNAATRMVRIVADGICSVAFGANPTATTSNSRMAAGVERILKVQPGHKVAVITNT